MRPLIPVTLLIVVTACEYPRKRVDPAAQPLTRCEWVASRSIAEKFDREIFRRLPQAGQTGPEVFWRDTFLQGRPVRSMKYSCTEDDEGLKLTTLEKIVYPR